MTNNNTTIDDKDWYSVDNVANVFLSSVNARDTRSLRISCTLVDNINPELLQKALDETIKVWGPYQVRIRKGFFWHYIEASDAIPVVAEESRRLCPLLYYPVDGEDLHYQVTWYHNRINLDIFHALADGLGAVIFLNAIVFNYLKLAYPDFKGKESPYGNLTATDMTEDSYMKFYEKGGKSPKSNKKAYHPKGKRLPHDQLQFFELHIPLDQVLPRAKEMKVSLTSYLGARLFLALLAEMAPSDRSKPVTISMPVNLRNFFPSNSARNFFQNITITHMYTGNETLQSLAEKYAQTLKASLNIEDIKSMTDYYTHVQQIMIVRLIPLVFKQTGLRFLSKQNDKQVSAILSNLGQIHVPEEMKPYIEYYGAYCSSENIFFTVCSFKNKLVISITSPYQNVNAIKNFVRGFSADNIPVELYSTEVVK